MSDTITWDNLEEQVASLNDNRELEAEAQYLAANPEIQSLEDQTSKLAWLKGMTSFGNPFATGTKRIVTSGLASRAVNANKGSGLSYNSELGDIARLAMKNNAAFGKKATAIADVKRPSLLRNIDAENAALSPSQTAVSLGCTCILGRHLPNPKCVPSAEISPVKLFLYATVPIALL